MRTIDARDPWQRLLLLEQVERSERYGAGERIGGKGMAVGQGALEAFAEERLEHRLARDRDGHRHVAGGEPFRQADEIGNDLGLLLANSEPVRPNPVATSSKITSTPASCAALTRRLRKSGRQTRMPPAPCSRGSMMSAAIPILRSVSVASKAESAPASRSPAASSPSNVPGNGSTQTLHIRSLNGANISDPRPSDMAPSVSP